MSTIRTLVISDIHGCYEEFMEMLDKIEYVPNDDKLVLLGDYIDRGKDSKLVIEKVMDLSRMNNVTVLKGNHEEMLLKFLESPLETGHWWMQNGGDTTLKSYLGSDADPYNLGYFEEAKRDLESNFKSEIEFIKNMSSYSEDKEHIFVHAGIEPFTDDWKSNGDRVHLWTRELFLNYDHQQDKTVVFGHTPTISIQDHEGIYYGTRKIGIDGGCCFGHQLNCLEINDTGYVFHSINSKK